MKNINLAVFTDARVVSTYTRNGDAYVRVMVGTPEGNAFVTLVFPNAAAQGIRFQEGQTLTVHRAYVRSRDIRVRLGRTLEKVQDNEGRPMHLNVDVPDDAWVPQVATEFVVQEFTIG